MLNNEKAVQNGASCLGG